MSNAIIAPIINPRIIKLLPSIEFSQFSNPVIAGASGIEIKYIKSADAPTPNTGITIIGLITAILGCIGIRFN